VAKENGLGGTQKKILLNRGPTSVDINKELSKRNTIGGMNPAPKVPNVTI